MDSRLDLASFLNFVLIFHLTQYNFTNFFTLRKLKQQSVNSVISRFFKFLKSLVEIPWIDNNVINAVITRTQWIEHHSWPSIKLIEIPHGCAIREFQSFIEGHLWCSISIEYLWWPHYRSTSQFAINSSPRVIANCEFLRIAKQSYFKLLTLVFRC